MQKPSQGGRHNHLGHMMTARELVDKMKHLFITLVVLIVVIPVGVYLLTPAAYFVEGDGAVTVCLKAIDGPLEIRCPRFQITSTAMTVTDTYSSCKSVVKGEFEYVLPRGLRTVGPVFFHLTCDDEALSAVVTVQSKDHPIVPTAFIHMARSRVQKRVMIENREVLIEVIWDGAADTSVPPLKSVWLDGKPVSERLTRLGVI